MAAAPMISGLEIRLAESIPLDVLLVEDNPVNQKVALYMLARIGSRADTAANGLDVLEAERRQAEVAYRAEMTTLMLCGPSFTASPPEASASPSKTGTSFIPQMVQLPGLSDLIHGCIGLWKKSTLRSPAAAVVGWVCCCRPNCQPSPAATASATIMRTARVFIGGMRRGARGVKWKGVSSF